MLVLRTWVRLPSPPPVKKLKVMVIMITRKIALNLALVLSSFASIYAMEQAKDTVGKQPIFLLGAARVSFEDMINKATISTGFTKGNIWIRVEGYTFTLITSGPERGDLQAQHVLVEKNADGTESIYRFYLKPDLAKERFMKLLAKLKPADPVLEIVKKLEKEIAPDRAHL